MKKSIMTLALLTSGLTIQAEPQQIRKKIQNWSSTDYLRHLFINNPYTSPKVKDIAKQLLQVKGRDALVMEVAKMLNDTSDPVLEQACMDSAELIMKNRFSDPVQEELFTLALQNSLQLFTIAKEGMTYLKYRYANPTQELESINLMIAQQLSAFNKKVNENPVIANLITEHNAAVEARENLYQDRVNLILHSPNPEVQTIGRMFSQKNPDYLCAQLLSPLLLGNNAQKQAIGIYLGRLVLQGKDAITINTAEAVLEAFFKNDSKAAEYLKRLRAALGNSKELLALDYEIRQAALIHPA